MTKPQSQRNVLSRSSRSSLTLPQAEQVLEVGNHCLSCTTFLPVFCATHLRMVKKSKKPRSLTFLPHSLCMALILSFSKHMTSYCLQRWWASHQWYSRLWLATRLCTLARVNLALWRLLLPFCLRERLRLACLTLRELRKKNKGDCICVPSLVKRYVFKPKSKPAVLPVLAMSSLIPSAFATTHSHKSPTRSRLTVTALILSVSKSLLLWYLKTRLPIRTLLPSRNLYPACLSV